ncbi:class I SAM-dependent methyltransferase [Alcanivorax sp. 1008]|uniref:class I SAM-dependent methyltransferase n=1 Tax=Alcanivorax sp. 1008 TaxID=2816853 RepID=UPI001D7A48AB|nr:class I SAM-dependent methyltransferase [Alcanivorax sp. 1008]MCC1496808.1 DUF4942 domain-containing protein [Alcanivorax sp. 1008]
MGAAVDIAGAERVEIVQDFFAPVSFDLVDRLVASYRGARAEIEQVSETISGSSVLGYFLDGNASDMPYRPSPGSIFQLDGALRALNAAYWSKALALTDVYDLMPQARRDDWNDLVRSMKTPEFEEDTVRATLQDLLLSREQFLAERVDGIFKSLSRSHVTNHPQAFSKRMIIQYAVDSLGYIDSRRAGYINDLRCVIARFMGREMPPHYSSAQALRAALAETGKWMVLDGGALKVRVYKVGTAHLEIHPDMAWRLNAILANLYPAAIPEALCRKPVKTKRTKEWAEIRRPLSFEVIGLLAELKPAYHRERDHMDRVTRTPIENAVEMPFRDLSKSTMAEAESVLRRIGGVECGPRTYVFEYDPESIINEIVCSGCVPDEKACQFYPTPVALAERVIDLADIRDHHRCLEPSAGTGGLADLMPKEQTVCVEASHLHAKVLEAKGYQVTKADFLTLQGGQYHRVVMNPPFDGATWKHHLQHAASMVVPGGRLVAILPGTARGKDDLLPGFDCDWSEMLVDQFEGTGVQVVILTADKQES